MEISRDRVEECALGNLITIGAFQRLIRLYKISQALGAERVATWKHARNFVGVCRVEKVEADGTLQLKLIGTV